MSKEEEVQKQLKDMQDHLTKEPEKKPDSKVGKILRLVLTFIVLALIFAIVVMGLLRR